MDARRILYDIVYVPIMKRWGYEEGHHYLLGVFTDLEEAKKVAKQEEEDRAGKYEWVIEAMPLNKARKNWVKGIYRVAKSEEMNCLIDDERDYIVGSVKLFNEYYEKCDQAKLKTEEEKLLLKLAAIRKVMK